MSIQKCLFIAGCLFIFASRLAESVSHRADV